MNYRDFSSARHWQQSYLCIAITHECVDRKLLKVICERTAILKKRFGMSIVLVAASPDDLGVVTIRELLATGAVSYIAFSGSDDYVYHDMLAAAKRMSGNSIVFAHGADLTHGFPAILKFIVECSNTSLQQALSRCGRLLYAAIDVAKDVALHDYAEEWPVFLRVISEEINAFFSDEESTESVSGAMLRPLLAGKGVASVPSGRPRNMFITKTGLDRLGGFARLQSLPIEVAGKTLAEYSTFWVIDNNMQDGIVETPDAHNKNSKLRVIKGCERLDQADRYLMFDINPAPVWPGTFDPDTDVEKTVKLPRQILYARILENAGLAKDEETAVEAVFIMSNYNKSRYIHATLYSVICQTYPKVRVEVVDDISTDDSIARVKSFRQLLKLPDSLVKVQLNPSNRGTYWIRNSIIAKYKNSENIYLVNDSDDYSAAQRAYLQLRVIRSASAMQGCFGDIVRVDQSYSLLPLNNQVERYGTASLGCKAKLHAEIGFFQNIRKNADTEFIERVKGFVSKSAIKWFRYPVLFQPFDGGNLTADIYEIGKKKKALVQSLGNRSAHTDAFKKHHARLEKKDVAGHFSFPLSSLPKEYASIGNDFFINGYRGFDACLLIVPPATGKNLIEGLAKKGFHVMFRTENYQWKILSGNLLEYVSDLGLFEALSQYIKYKDFYGYILPTTLLAIDEDNLKKPSEILRAQIQNLVYRSKSESDKYIYSVDIENSMSLTALDSESLKKGFKNLQDRMEKPIFFHSEALSNIQNSINIII